MSSKKALVLGVSGMVGGALAEELVHDGWEVYGGARFSSKERNEETKALGVKCIEFDVTCDDPAVLPDVDVLFLEVWDPNKPELIWPINFYGVGRVVERYAGVADIVNGCTINVYGNGPDACTEDTALRPTSEYGHSRAAQENLINYFSWKGNKKAIHVRYAHANSANRGVVYRMAKNILEEKSLGTDPDAKIQVIALEDFVRVTKCALEHASCPPTAVNCCHPKVWTRKQLAQKIREKLGKGKVNFDKESGGVENSAYADVSRMVNWFGQPQIDIDNIIDRVVSAL